MKDVTNTEYTEEMKLEGAEGGGAEKKKPSWLNRSKEGGIKKLPKEVIRRRRNFRLKKMLTPKAPIMVLNELLGQTKVIYEEKELQVEENVDTEGPYHGVERALGP